MTDKADAALLAYAQKRVRLLEDTLQEREHHQGKLLEEALQKQQNEHEKLSAMKLKHELEKLRTELNSLMMQKVNYINYMGVFCLKFHWKKCETRRRESTGYQLETFYAALCLIELKHWDRL